MDPLVQTHAQLKPESSFDTGGKNEAKGYSNILVTAQFLFCDVEGEKWSL